MNTKASRDSEPAQAAELRRKAEERLRASEARPAEVTSVTDARALVHELQVHQIELEMQNEELQRARMEAEEASEKYYDLFDFAPVGYFLWDHEGRILEVNLAGAALLGLDRSAASQKRFGQFVAAEYRGAFADFLKRVLATDAKQTCEVKLQRDGSSVWVLVEGIAAQDRQGPAETLPRGGHRHHPTEARGRVGGSQPSLGSRNRGPQTGGGGAAAGQGGMGTDLQHGPGLRGHPGRSAPDRSRQPPYGRAVGRDARAMRGVALL